MKKLEFKMPSVQLSQLSSIVKHKPEPVFNRPMRTERPYQVSRAIYITLLSLMVALAIATIGLKTMTLIFIEDNNNTGFTFQTEDPTPTTLAALPLNLYHAPAKLAIVAGVTAMCIGLAHGGFVLVDWKHGERTQSYAFRRNTMFLHFTNSILILFSLVCLFVTHKSTSHFREGYIMRKAADPSRFPTNPEDPDEGIQYNIGTFDLETWSCELKTMPGASVVFEEYKKQCDIEIAGRAVVVPFMIVGFLVTGWSIAQMMRCRRDADGERMKTEDVGIEMGKFNAI